MEKSPEKNSPKRSSKRDQPESLTEKLNVSGKPKYEEPEEGENLPVIVQEEKEDIGPEDIKNNKIIENEQDYELQNLPSAEMYERSYQHKDIMQTIYVSTQTDMIITISVDGFIKFWRKAFHGIEFVRAFHAHPGKCTGTTLSWNGRFFASVSNIDKGLKHFDVINADMINMHKLSFEPSICEFIYKLNEIKPIIAVSELNSSKIFIIQLDATPIILKTLEIHISPLKILLFNPKYETVFSADQKGIIEYWDSNSFEFPKNKVSFKHKITTDLIEYAKTKTQILSATLSHNNELIAIYGKDRTIRIFVFETGKLYRKFSEPLEKYAEWQSDKKDPLMSLDKIEYERRFALEKDIDKNIDFIPPPNIQFSENDSYILWPSYLGIKVVDHEKGELVTLLGKMETNERFLHIALYFGLPKKNPSTSALASKEELDPALFCTAYKKSRFYLFTRREPEEHQTKKATSRDILNEQPSQEQLQLAHNAAKALSTQVFF